MSNITSISVTELARRTGLPVAWLRAEASAQRIPHLKVGRRRLFDPDAVRRTLTEREAGAKGGSDGRR